MKVVDYIVMCWVFEKRFLLCRQVLTSFETNIPYCLDPHSLETLGPENLNGNLHFGCFAAHFRIDSERQVIFLK